MPNNCINGSNGTRFRVSFFMRALYSSFMEFNQIGSCRALEMNFGSDVEVCDTNVV